MCILNLQHNLNVYRHWFIKENMDIVQSVSLLKRNRIQNKKLSLWNKCLIAYFTCYESSIHANLSNLFKYFNLDICNYIIIMISRF
mgnify:CR=1 FL=1